MWGALFPGQGSQQIGMGQFLFDNFKIVQHLFEEASDTLKIDFKKLCFTGDEKELGLTHNTQPALVLVSTCYSKVFKELTNKTFNFCAGHSVGEYSALVHSESLAFSDALKSVRKRGQEMQSAVPVGEGGMVAVLGLNTDQALKLTQWAVEKSGQSPIECANFNSPGQIVISGNKQALDWLVANVTKDLFSEPPKRLKLIPLKVSAPFHCSMMKPAQDAMEAFLDTVKFNDATTPIVQNTVATSVTEKLLIKKNIIEQISAPVKWQQSIDWMINNNVQNFIELGHGKVLSGLNKKINSEITTYSFNNLDELKEVEKCLT